MIIITGEILSRRDSFEELQKLSLAHVGRSRSEPGCLSHAVYLDVENPLRLFFFEAWADRAAVAAHFAVPASREFVKAANHFASAPPNIQIFDAEPSAARPADV